MWKSGLLFLVGATALSAAVPPQQPSTALDNLKKAFPAHIAGPVTDKTDPLISECFDKYRAAVDKLTPKTLGRDVSALRKTLERDIDHFEGRAESAKEPTGSSARPKVLTPSMRAAYQANASWLKTKVRPFMARLESLQRGRN